MYPIVPADTMTRNDCQPVGTSRPKTTTCWPANAPAASAPAYTITSSLAAGSTASTSISTKTAYTPWSPMNDVRASVIETCDRTLGARAGEVTSGYGARRTSPSTRRSLLRSSPSCVQRTSPSGRVAPLLVLAVPHDAREARPATTRPGPPCGSPFPRASRSASSRTRPAPARTARPLARGGVAPTTPAQRPSRTRASC